MRPKKLCLLAVLACLSTAVLTACGGSDDESDKAPALASTVNEACTLGDKEGAFNYWRSGDQGDLEDEMAPFRKEHPDIKITIGLYKPNDIVQRLSAEKQGGHAPGADAIEGDLGTFAPLFQQGQLLDFDWSSTDVSDDVIVEQDGIHGLRMTRTPAGIGYNTDLVSEDELPNTWDELADSKWSKKVLYDPRGTYLQGLAVAWGADKASSWFDNFVKTADAVPLEGSTAGLEAVGAGQYLITTSGSADDAKAQADAGAPIGLKFLDVVPVTDYNSLLVAGSAHPNAALCFLDWWASPEAAALKKQIEGKVNDTQPVDVPADAKLAVMTTAEDADNATTFVEHVASASQ